MGIRRLGADLPAAASLPGLRLADPLARHVADHQRRVGEQDSITVSGCAVRPADGLPGAACPAGVRDLAGCAAPLTWRGGDRVIAYVVLAVRDDPPVVLCPCGTPPARLPPAIGPR